MEITLTVETRNVCLKKQCRVELPKNK